MKNKNNFRKYISLMFLAYDMAFIRIITSNGVPVEITTYSIISVFTLNACIIMDCSVGIINKTINKFLFLFKKPIVIPPYFEFVILKARVCFYRILHR